ncbi:AAA family ATPase, partial [Arthrospira platensis SPKY2]
LNKDSIIDLISELLDLPIKKLNENEKDILLNIDAILSKRLIGQPMAVSAIAKSLKRARAGVGNEKKPMGSFLFAGPTGVGKTEAAKVLSDLYFGSEDSMIRFD